MALLCNVWYVTGGVQYADTAWSSVLPARTKHQLAPAAAAALLWSQSIYFSITKLIVLLIRKSKKLTNLGLHIFFNSDLDLNPLSR